MMWEFSHYSPANGKLFINKEEDMCKIVYSWG